MKGRVGCMWVPGRHGMAADAPSRQTEPAGQSSHAVAPSSSWNLPAAHLVHVACFGWSLNVPALQLVAASLPTGQKVPSGHVTQSALLVIEPTKPTGVDVPAGHGSGAAEPSAQ